MEVRTYAGGRVVTWSPAWGAAPYKENPATILVYNADPPRLIQETPELVAKYPELSSGVIDLRLSKEFSSFRTWMVD